MEMKLWEVWRICRGQNSLGFYENGIRFNEGISVVLELRNRLDKKNLGSWL